MTDEEAARVLAPLAVAFPFKDDTVDLWMLKLRALSEPRVAMRTANALIDEMDSMRAPPWSVFLKQYQRFYARFEEEQREAQLALEQPQGRLAGMVSPREGRHIAAAAYAKAYRRTPPADIFALLDPERIQPTTPEDVERALDVIRGGYDHEGMTFSHYRDVLAAFMGHQGSARAAVRALEAGGRVRHLWNGVLVLLRYPDAIDATVADG